MKEITEKTSMPKDLGSYKLSVCDVQKERRNFPGYEEKSYFSLQDIVSGDTCGSTETDSKTDKPSGHYTKINQKSGKAHSARGTVTTPRALGTSRT